MNIPEERTENKNKGLRQETTGLRPARRWGVNFEMDRDTGLIEKEGNQSSRRSLESRNTQLGKKTAIDSEKKESERL